MNVQSITTMSEIKFNLTPIEKKPSRRFKRGSKYDPIIDAFTEGDEDLVEVSVQDKDANYLRTQLTKRIDARNLDGVKVSVVNNVCYLEKT
jgi:hypothetical protein